MKGVPVKRVIVPVLSAPARKPRPPSIRVKYSASEFRKLCEKLASHPRRLDHLPSIIQLSCGVHDKKLRRPKPRQSSRNIAYASSAADPAETRFDRKEGFSSSRLPSWTRLKCVWPTSSATWSLRKLSDSRMPAPRSPVQRSINLGP